MIILQGIELPVESVLIVCLFIASSVQGSSNKIKLVLCFNFRHQFKGFSSRYSAHFLLISSYFYGLSYLPETSQSLGLRGQTFEMEIFCSFDIILVFILG